VEYREIGFAELKIDCYHGPDCDQHRPYWQGYFEGDKESAKISGPLELSNKHFKAGTKITISVPLCPECKEHAEICSCGFNWKEWEAHQYS